MSLATLLITTIRALEETGVPYMLTGSLASTFHGEPRSTRDIDIVIEPSAEDLASLLDRLRKDGMYVDEEAAMTALSERGQFNAIATDAKVDFIVRKDTPFARAEFERRERVQLPGVEGHIVTVEDLIIAKLVWARETDSERQVRDVAGMADVVGAQLDRGYLTTWAERLGVADAWRRIDEPPPG